MKGLAKPHTAKSGEGSAVVGYADEAGEVPAGLLSVMEANSRALDHITNESRD